ncbi:phosphate ABC transporter substrate-binding protein [Clostridium sp. CX1]|uniref:phosphate ABC transporter substrate-binding protein n=1 Tax=Clostridium sp. CX1 TaxID=2978346 RepID=UPI0021BFABC2|nr:phosphate ABC transporter substrate-binding protein [Clostridium sp. CX1]MCT8976899.1 phosphate ABC transporter substrate-binding protein [Clostridium sp. CX1]
MKKVSLRAIMAALAIVTISTAFTACGNNESIGNTETSGLITLAGSTALQPLADQSGRKFSEKYPNALINVQGGGSGTGIRLVYEGTAEIGNSDVYAEKKLDKEKAKELVDHKVCAIGFAVVVSNDVKIDSLTKSQIQDIFSGKITNWKEVGGENQKIEVFHRSKGSGTRAAFKDTVMGGIEENDAVGQIQDSNGAVEKSMESTKGSISYLALSALTSDTAKKNIRTLKIEGIEATKEKITTGEYPFWSYEHMYTKGEAKDLTKTFLDYMVSDENKPIVEKMGYIPISDMKIK